MGVDIETIKAGDGANFPPKGCKVQGMNYNFNSFLWVVLIFDFLFSSLHWYPYQW